MTDEDLPSCPRELLTLELYRDLSRYMGSGALVRRGQTIRRLWERWDSYLSTWQAAYPHVDVVAEIRKAHAWELCNPGKRKRDVPRFLNNWLKNAERQKAAGHQQGEWTV